MDNSGGQDDEPDPNKDFARALVDRLEAIEARLAKAEVGARQGGCAAFFLVVMAIMWGLVALIYFLAGSVKF